MCKCKMAAICKFYEPVRVDVENDDSHKIEIILPKKRGGYKKKSQGRGKGKGNRIKLTTRFY